MRTLNHRTLRALYYFKVIVDQGSIKRAAQQLGITPPVVSSALSQLESELGTTLLFRTTRSQALTETGKEIYRHAVAMIEHAGFALDLACSEDVEAGKLSISLPSELATSWLPDQLREFSRRFSAISVDVEATDDIHDLNSGKFDLALRATYIPLPEDAVSGSSFLAVMPLDLVVGAGWPVITGNVPDEEIAVPLLTRQSRTSPEITAFEKRNGTKCSLRFSCSSKISNKVTAREMVREGLGAALLVKSGLEEDYERGTLKCYAPEYSFGGIGIRLLRRDKHPSAPARLFEKFLIEKLTGAENEAADFRQQSHRSSTPGS